MAGGNHTKGSSSHKPSSSSVSHRKSRWESGADKKPSVAGSGAEKKPFAAGLGDSNKPTPPKSSSTPKENPSPKPLPNPSPIQATQPIGPAPPGEPPFQLLDGLGPPPPPAYGFHMLERRTIVLADGSVRSYFALPPDYQDFAPPPPRPMLPPAPELASRGMGFDQRFPPLGPMSPEFRDRQDPYMRERNQDYWNSLGLDGRGSGHLPPPENSLKRKLGEESERGRRDERDGMDEFARHRQRLLHYGNLGMNSNGYPMGPGGRVEFLAGTSSPYPRDVVDVGKGEELRTSKIIRTAAGVYEDLHGCLEKSFLNFVKLVHENERQRINYLENGKHGPLQCVVCGSLLGLHFELYKGNLPQAKLLE
ncbi:unnamed protein product [Thlaspi arvense]|uniref:Uncharacterized protein n=1 Tax=Thlaspi arvense TaxID=13288 RepID=A0AAU9RTB9_THLAR|nr:unnamed protein product [Thlaspi arvense]